ncbi:hypothetical protein GUG62_22955 [Xanthomonas citri pv. citri]|nr:hypothetical protein [Xanthomonas citri pv. citri]
MKPITKIKPVYPVVTETVEYAAVGAAARDLSFLFPRCSFALINLRSSFLWR